jgi:ribosomal protein S18 acetylase RimI-like enzyme
LKSNIQIKVIKPGDRDHLSEVEKLLKKMYSEMSSNGLMLQLTEGGAGLWVNSIEKTLGRLSWLLISREGEQVTGFAHGALRFLPDYLGGHLTGNITHIYVIPEARGTGTAKKLLQELEDWFIEKRVHSVDLQVIPENEAARRFWAGAGYPIELIQHRKIIS